MSRKQSITEKSRGETQGFKEGAQRQELNQSPLRCPSYCVAGMIYSACIPMQPRSTCTGVALPSQGLGLSASIINFKAMCYTLAYRQSDGDIFSIKVPFLRQW